MKIHSTGGRSVGLVQSPISATATAENGTFSDLTSLELAVGLLREWQLRGVPLLNYERTLAEVQAAIEREVPGWAPSLPKVAEKIRVAQERYFRWVRKRTDDYMIYAHLWFHDGLYRKRGRERNAYLAAMLSEQRPVARARRRSETVGAEVLAR